MKWITSIIFLCFSLVTIAQDIECAVIVERYEPSPHILFNDSIHHLLKKEEIEKLGEEQNLIFSFRFKGSTGEIIDLHMNYFYEPEFSQSEPLNPGLINLLESFFIRNIKVIIKKEYLNPSSDFLVECSFITHVENE